MFKYLVLLIVVLSYFNVESLVKKRPCPLLADCYCQYGYALDQNGCQTCECIGDPCWVIRCSADFPYCYNGSCHSTPECPTVDCYCQYGYIYDSNGCKTCECTGDPCWAIRCTATNPYCYNGGCHSTPQTG